MVSLCIGFAPGQRSSRDLLAEKPGGNLLKGVLGMAHYTVFACGQRVSGHNRDFYAQQAAEKARLRMVEEGREPLIFSILIWDKYRRRLLLPECFERVLEAERETQRKEVEEWEKQFRFLEQPSRRTHQSLSAKMLHIFEQLSFNMQDGVLEYANRCLAACYGYKTDEPIAKKPAIGSVISVDFQARRKD